MGTKNVIRDTITGKWHVVDNSTKDMEIAFLRDEVTSTASSWASVASFIFSGSTSYGVPTSIKVIARREGGVSADIRIVDISNGSLIIAQSNFSNTTDTILDLGILSNISATEVMWEVQVQRVGGGGKVFVQAVHVRF